MATTDFKNMTIEQIVDSTDLKNLSNATQQLLIDEIYKLRQVGSKLEKAEKTLTEALKARLTTDGQPTPITESNYSMFDGRMFKGEIAQMTVKYIVQERFDTKRFKAEHPETAKQYVNEIDFVQLKFSPKE